MTAPAAETFAALERELAACKDALYYQTETSNESPARLEAVSDVLRLFSCMDAKLVRHPARCHSRLLV